MGKFKQNFNRSALISFILGLIIGISANLLTPFIISLWGGLWDLITANRLPWIIVGILLLVLCVLLYLRRQDGRRHDYLFSFANSLSTALTGSIGETDVVAGLHRLVYLLLDTTLNAFDLSPRRGIFLLPDTNREYLILFGQCGHGLVPDGDIDKIKFYIGGNGTLKKEKGGVAGRVWETKEPCLCYFQTQKDIEQATNNGYIVFEYEQQTNGFAQVPYRSLYCVPVIRIHRDASGEHKDVLGVICFDSTKRNHFNSKHVKNVLAILAKYIDLSLQTKDELQKLHGVLSSTH